VLLVLSNALLMANALEWTKCPGMCVLFFITTYSFLETTFPFSVTATEASTTMHFLAAHSVGFCLTVLLNNYAILTTPRNFTVMVGINSLMFVLRFLLRYPRVGRFISLLLTLLLVPLRVGLGDTALGDTAFYRA
jgi:hypothetical protein